MTTTSTKQIDAVMRHLVVKKIYSLFESWSAQITFACRKGCSVCCTQDVTMTAVEADIIIRFIARQNRQPWLLEKLKGGLPPNRPPCTTNEYARACLNGEEIDPGSGSYDRVCPFLVNDTCTIYQVRPFNCRIFASQQTCRKGISASVPDYYLSGATAVSQIIEHLAQNEPWGNMLHLLAQATRYQAPDIHYLVAQPLPGFLIGEDDYPRVAPLIEQIFSTDLGGKTLEAILNGC